MRYGIFLRQNGINWETGPNIFVDYLFRLIDAYLDISEKQITPGVGELL